MRRLMLLLFVTCTSLSAWTPEKWFDQPLSPRIANYRVEATLNWPEKTLQAKEVISWRNAGTKATRDFPLHLYLNAFKGPQSLFVKESGGRLRGDSLNDPKDSRSWGYCKLRWVRMEGRDLEGHYGKDETVYWVKLPREVQPGESIDVEIAWENRYPRVFARSGWAGHFLMSGQWFPKVGVYQGERWSCEAYHAFTEFFSDFGTYDVELSLPNQLRLAHTGIAIPYIDSTGKAFDARPDPEHKLHNVWKLHAEDVHDFAWAVMPKGSWAVERQDYRKVQVFYFYQPENLNTLKRQKEAVEAALRLSEDWYFHYPYPTLTVVDTPKGASGADGMEYPTFITASSIAFDPFKQRILPEVVTVHEFGHQFFYGMLASNEIEEPWLDEGFTSWFTFKAVDQRYQSLFGTRRFHVQSDFGEWAGYWMSPSVDPLTQAGYKDRDWGSYGTAAYSKPTQILNQLEAQLGRPLMEEVIRAYATEMRFKHPTRDDFRRIAERVSGRDLSPFWRDFVEGTDILDYAISKVGDVEITAGGWMDGPKGVVFTPPQPTSLGHRGSITLVRRGGLIRPFKLRIWLENKRELNLSWDGIERWKTFDESDGIDSPIVSALLDPDGNYPLLKDRLHATYTAKPSRQGFQYWSQMVWGMVTGLLQGGGLG
jgi:hypothetical protein